MPYEPRLQHQTIKWLKKTGLTVYACKITLNSSFQI